MGSTAEELSLGSFEIHGNTLVANVELYWENHAEFLKCVEQLLKGGGERVILDFSQVNFIFSAYMGTIGKLVAEVAKANKKLTIRINNNLSWLFEIVGFEKIVEIERIAY